MKPLPSLELLKKHFSYDQATGDFTWIKPIAYNIKPGAIAGKTDAHGYRVLKLDSKHYLAHRIAWLFMTGEEPPRYIDHKNTNRSDNRWANLRAATNSQNVANGKVRVTNRLGIKGVVRVRSKKPQWHAHICKDGKNVCLGKFSSPEFAQAAYLTAARRLFGEFANAG